MDRKMTSDVKIPSQEFDRPEEVETKKKPSVLRWIIVVIVVLAIIFVALYGVSKMTRLNILGLDKNGSGGKWQAVFLSNGQVYFGQMSHEGDQTVVLKNIYYLQVTNSLQPDGSQNTQTETQNQGELSLVKLGNELHGPVDLMKINRDHILFVEDLKSDGKVVRAIQKYIEDQKK